MPIDGPDRCRDRPSCDSCSSTGRGTTSAAVRAAATACYVHVDAVSGRAHRHSFAGPADVDCTSDRCRRRGWPLALDALHAVGPSAAVSAIEAMDTSIVDEVRARAADLAAGGDGVGAARLRSAAGALAGALGRQRIIDGARRRGCATFEAGGRSLALDHGLLAGVGGARERPVPLAIGPQAAADWADTDCPIPRWAAAEVLRVGKRLGLGET